ncbi:MAG: bifunctional phosphopantothenoylcysteine decarboxylase/phosphopantothenate--cysteine ligase CoaBC [Gammaproteobacteria bacterium]
MTEPPRSAVRGRRVLLGVTAGIAAYKAAELARLLIKAGAEVRVVMTPSAARFVAPLTFQALTGEMVRTALFDEAHEAAMGHIELARWADVVLVAPASADFLARCAAGMADDLLTTLCLASDAPLLVAPAMNRTMWAHPATVDNVALLRRRGVVVLPPASGEQACGEVGPGRLPEPPELLAVLAGRLGGGRLGGLRAVVTAGPTREPLDPVRFLGNRSSGRMGYAVARALAAAGAEVELVSGPVALDPPAGVRRRNVESAQEMRRAVFEVLPGADLFVATAAVADYRPAEPAPGKIKKQAERLTVELVRNPDILAEVAAQEPRPFIVGFAAETDDLAFHAEHKRRAKGLDMIAANLVGSGRLGFDTGDNSLLVLWEGGRADLPVQPKTRLAEQLVALIAERLHAPTAAEDS